MKLEARKQSDALVVWTIRLVVLVAFLDLFMQLPVISTFAQSLDAAAAMGGAIVGMYSAANLVSNVGAGFLLDRLNRRYLMIVGMLLTAASLYAYGIVQSPIQLLALRAVHGACAGVLAPGAFAMMGDRARGQQTRAMGISGALIAVSAVIGPAVSGVVREAWGFETVFNVSGTMMILAAAAFWVYGAKTSDLSGRATPSEGPSHRSILNGPLIRVYSTVMVMTFGIGVLISHLPIMVEGSGGSARLSGFAFTLFSIVASIVMASPFQRSLEATSRHLALVAGLLLTAVGGIALALSAGSMVVAMASMVVYGVGFGLLFPSLSASVPELTPRGQRGAAFGIFYATYSLGVVLGSGVSGLVYGELAGLGTPFWTSAVVAVVGLPVVTLPIAFRVLTRTRNRRPSEEGSGSF